MYTYAIKLLLYLRVSQDFVGLYAFTLANMGTIGNYFIIS